MGSDRDSIKKMPEFTLKENCCNRFVRGNICGNSMPGGGPQCPGGGTQCPGGGTPQSSRD